VFIATEQISSRHPRVGMIDQEAMKFSLSLSLSLCAAQSLYGLWSADSTDWLFLCKRGRCTGLKEF
jgi:hypothetical protein